MDLDGNVAVVTGGAGFIGSACARRLAGEGAAVVVSDLPGAGVERVVEQVRAAGHQAMGHEGDIRDEQAVKHLVVTGLRECRIDAW